MGATNFETKGQGRTIGEAFDRLVTSARHEYGHGGYTGTIAEKQGYVLLPAPPAGIELRAAIAAAINDGVIEKVVEVPADKIYAQGGTCWRDRDGKFYGYETVEPTPAIRQWLAKAAPIANEKWGPAAAIEVKAPKAGAPGEWIFFGMASE